MYSLDIMSTKIYQTVQTCTNRIWYAIWYSQKDLLTQPSTQVQTLFKVVLTFQ